MPPVYRADRRSPADVETSSTQLSSGSGGVMRTRWLALAPALGLVLATAAHAAPTTVPQIKDAPNDAVGGQAGMDIASVLFTTSGKGSGKAYQPKELSITMTLAGPVSSGPGLTYEVDAKTDTCGDVSFTYEPGTVYGTATGRTGWAIWGSCENTAGDGSSVELLAPEVKGNTITWTFSLKATGLKVGSSFSSFAARVDPTNPVLPYPSHGDAGYTGAGLVDAATGSGTWKLG
jgi:hypothetical protein